MICWYVDMSTLRHTSWIWMACHARHKTTFYRCNSCVVRVTSNVKYTYGYSAGDSWTTPVNSDMTSLQTVVEPRAVIVIWSSRVRVIRTNSGLILVAVPALFSVRPACPTGRAVKIRWTGSWHGQPSLSRVSLRPLAFHWAHRLQKQATSVRLVVKLGV